MTLYENTITREVNPQDENNRIFEAYQKSIFGKEEENKEKINEVTNRVDKPKFIRDELKKMYKLSNRDVSVRMSRGSAIQIDLKTPKALPYYVKIKNIGEGQESVRRDEYTGSILRGGNLFVFVELDWKFREKLINKIETDILRKVTGDFMNDIGTNVIDMYGNYKIVKEPGKKEFRVMDNKQLHAGRPVFSIAEAAGNLLHKMLENEDANALKKIS